MPTFVGMTILSWMPTFVGMTILSWMPGPSPTMTSMPGRDSIFPTPGVTRSDRSGVDGRDKPGHDAEIGTAPPNHSTTVRCRLLGNGQARARPWRHGTSLAMTASIKRGQVA